MSNVIYHTPYTYLIKFKPTGQVYYGVRFAKNCHPNDLWNTYFTSSKTIKTLIEEHGSDAFDYEIRKTFDTVDAAREWETQVLQRMKVIHSDIWLNKNDTISIQPMLGADNPFFGKNHSEQSKKIMKSKRSKQKMNPHTEETKRKISETLKGQKHSQERIEKMRISRTGIGHTEETKKKMSATRMNMPKIPCQYCGRGLKPPYLSRHEKSCKNKIISQDMD